MIEDDDGAEEATKCDKSDKKDSTNQEKNAEEATLSFDCENCDFNSNSENGLSIQMSKKHRIIEQIDSNNSFADDTDPCIENDVEKYLATGDLSCENFCFDYVCEGLISTIKNSSLNFSEKKKELLKSVEVNRKSIEKRWGPLEYLRFPPWNMGYSSRLNF